MRSWIRCALVSVVLGVGLSVLSAAPSTALLSPTPYMGWNTYYGVGGVFNQQTIVSVAQSLLDRGLAQAGYRIVWLDAGWTSGARDSSGQLEVNSTQWPNGLPWLTSWLHSQGLLAGIYTDAGATGCNSQGVGSLGHYQQDANTFAAWGFDAVKVDFCGAGQEGLNAQTQYTQFASALANNSSQRAMLLNVDNFWEPGQIDGFNPPYANSAYASYQWAPQVAQSWRTDTDIGFGAGRGINFGDVLRNLDADAAHPEAAGPGHWNDPDYLGPELGMSGAEAQAQLSMWAILAAPLIIGSDPRALSQGSVTMLGNPDVIAIDQDALGAQGTLLQQQGAGQVWVKPLSNGDRAVALLNRGSADAQITTAASAIGLPVTRYYQIHDVWQGTTTTDTGLISAVVPASSAVLYRVSALHTLNVDLAGSGAGTVASSAGISCPETCFSVFQPGSTVTLTAKPAPGSAFTGWSGSGCWGQGPCVVTMGSDQAVAATFATSTGTTGPTTSTNSGVRNQLRCQGPAGLRCPFVETLTTLETTRRGRLLAVAAAAKPRPRTATVVVGQKTVTVATGHSSMAKVALNKAGQYALKRFGKLPVSATIELGRNGQPVTLPPRTVTIKPKRASASRALVRTARLVWRAL